MLPTNQEYLVRAKRTIVVSGFSRLPLPRLTTRVGVSARAKPSTVDFFSPNGVPIIYS
jgi:hypothetical protein